MYTCVRAWLSEKKMTCFETGHCIFNSTIGGESMERHQTSTHTNSHSRLAPPPPTPNTHTMHTRKRNKKNGQNNGACMANLFMCLKHTHMYMQNKTMGHQRAKERERKTVCIVCLSKNAPFGAFFLVKHMC